MRSPARLWRERPAGPSSPTRGASAVRAGPEAVRPPDDSRRAKFDFPPVNKDRAFDCVDVMREIAVEHEASVAQIALAWLLHQSAVTSIIIGAKRIEQLEDNLHAVQIQLTDDQLQRLNTVSQLPLEYPNWMIERQASERMPQEA